MAVNVGAMLLVFIALIAMLNGILASLGGGVGLNSWIAAHTPYSQLSIELLLGYLFAPLMWLIGVAKEDITLVGQLLGVKLVASEFVGYTQLAELKNATEGLFFTHKKSIIMSTYILCGFANFASIGIQIGGIGIIAPKIRHLLTELGLKAMIGGIGFLAFCNYSRDAFGLKHLINCIMFNIFYPQTHLGAKGVVFVRIKHYVITKK